MLSTAAARRASHHRHRLVVRLGESLCRNHDHSFVATATARRFVSSLTKPKVVLMTCRPFEETIQTLVQAGLHVSCPSSSHDEEIWHTNSAAFSHHACEAHAWLAFMHDRCNAALLDKALPQLELIAGALKGFDNFDTTACAQRGVAVTAVPDLLTAPTAELAVTLALGLARRLREADAVVRSGQFQGWRPNLLYAKQGLANAVVGIYGGAGAVGRAVAQRVAGFAPSCILYHDLVEVAEERDNKHNHLPLPMERVDTLEDLMQQADVLFVCTPLTPTTHHSINAQTLALAKDLLLINISRGSCVKEADVADALQEGRLTGYAADVFECEDWHLPDRPRAIDPRLLNNLSARTLFTPHLGSAVTGIRRQIELAAVNEILCWHRGEPFQYRVN